MKQRVIDYHIEINPVHIVLIAAVKKLIKDGWQPYGDPFSVVTDGKDTGISYATFHQAMVKYAKTTRDEYLDEKLEFALTAMQAAFNEAKDEPTREILGSAIGDIFNREVDGLGGGND